MRFILIILLICLLGACDATRNSPDPEDPFFMRFYGDDGNQEAVDMIVNDDGTVILLGTSVKTSNKPSQVYLVKVTHLGYVVWEKFFGDGTDWIAKDVEQTSNSGEYVIAVEQVTSSSNTDFLIFTVTDSGSDVQIVNSGTFTFPGQSKEVPVSVTPITDNGIGSGFIVTGNTNYDNGTDPGFEGITAVFARFDQSCTLYAGSWINNAGGESDDYGVKVIQRADLTDPEPFVFFGYKNSPPIDDIANKSFNYWMSRVSNFGAGGGIGSGVLKNSPANEDEELHSISIVNSGALADYILSGIVSPLPSGDQRIFVSVVKDAALHEEGTLGAMAIPINLGNLTARDKKFASTSSTSLREGGYIIAGNSVTSGNSDMLLTKLNVDGTLEWTNPILLGGQGDDWQAKVHELPDGKILLLGTMQIGDDRQSKLALIKLNSYGELRE